MRSVTMIESLESRTFLSASPVVPAGQAHEAHHSAIHASLKNDSAAEDQAGQDDSSGANDAQDQSGGTTAGTTEDAKDESSATGSTSTATGSLDPAARTAHGGSIHHATHRLHVHGSIAGSFTAPVTNPDIGKTYNFTGLGTVSPLGAASLTGQITLPGNVATGRAAGQLTLTGPNGSITLTVTGPRERGSGPLPTKLSYTIASGTGSFANAKGGGHLSINLDAAAGKFTIKF
jgi:hypothetical protein